jgi:hypothetical protein
LSKENSESGETKQWREKDEKKRMRRSIYVPNIAARFKLVVPGGSPNPAAPKLALTFSNASSNVIPGTLRESPYDPSKSVDSAMIYRSLQLKLFYFFLKIWTLRKVVSEDVVWSDVEGVGTLPVGKINIAMQYCCIVLSYKIKLSLLSRNEYPNPS